MGHTGIAAVMPWRFQNCDNILERGNCLLQQPAGHCFMVDLALRCMAFWSRVLGRWGELELCNNRPEPSELVTKE